MEGKLFISCTEGKYDKELFEIIKNAAIRAFAPFVSKNIYRRLTVTLGSGYMVCLSNDEERLIANLADISDYEAWARNWWCQVGIIEISPEKDGVIVCSHHHSGISFEARRSNAGIDRTDRDKDLELEFKKRLKEAFASSKKYCLVN